MRAAAKGVRRTAAKRKPAASPAPGVIKRRAAVSTIVEAVLLSGSLSRNASAKRMLEGVRGHRALQAEAEPGVLNEVPVSCSVLRGGIELTVYGRIDRLHGDDVVEEIKTTLSPVRDERQTDPRHWAQATAYAHMLCITRGLPGLIVRLTYYDLGSTRTFSFDRVYAAEALEAAFSGLTDAYFRLLEGELLHQRRLADEIGRAAFPYEAFRPGQRAMAEQVYTAILQKRPLLCRAPTGTGKTMAALYPAVKAVGAGLIRRVFYLTARTTQQLAAQNAVERLGLPGLMTVVLAAREKQCVNGPGACRADECVRAQGYYDRLPAALNAAAEAGGLFTPERIRQLALTYMLCPFEFGLDLSLCCDVIVCDYNYAFDPRVRLQRYFQHGAQKQALLIDEAHNLPDRAREMYSAVLSLGEIRDACRAVPRQMRKGELYKSLRALIRAMQACFCEGAPARAETDPPISLSEPAATAAALLSEPDGAAASEEARRLLLSLTGFLYILERCDERYRVLYEGGKTARRITLLCADPSGELAASYKKSTAAVLFSATLTPPPFYQAVCGLGKDAPAFALGSPFPPENLLVLHRPLSVRYRAREATMPLVADACAAFVRSRANGNFMLYLPSYAYLAAFEPFFAAGVPDARLLVQRQDMDDAARAAFLEAFTASPDGCTAGLAVLGGAFAESIDLPAERLCGAAVVGVGMPQLGLSRDALRDVYEAAYGAGFDYAYRYPGMSRVLQAAGRIIRSETDRGALLLVDDRYAQSDYAQLLPETWRPVRVYDDAQMEKRLAAFWMQAAQQSIE